MPDEAPVTTATGAYEESLGDVNFRLALNYETEEAYGIAIQSELQPL